MKILLNEKAYNNILNALNFDMAGQHFEEGGKASSRTGKAYHYALGVIEAIPVVSQVVSIIELGLARLAIHFSRTPAADAKKTKSVAQENPALSGMKVARENAKKFKKVHEEIQGSRSNTFADKYLASIGQPESPLVRADEIEKAKEARKVEEASKKQETDKETAEQFRGAKQGLEDLIAGMESDEYDYIGKYQETQNSMEKLKVQMETAIELRESSGVSAENQKRELKDLLNQFKTVDQGNLEKTQDAFEKLSEEARKSEIKGAQKLYKFLKGEIDKEFEGADLFLRQEVIRSKSAIDAFCQKFETQTTAYIELMRVTINGLEKAEAPQEKEKEALKKAEAKKEELVVELSKLPSSSVNDLD